MSRDIIIQNNGVAVTYTGAKKIKTRKSTGGTLYWLPEGEQPTGTITITENGTYKAEEANLYAFSQAIVNVQKAPTHVTGKGQDGNMYDVTVDPETGDIVRTEVPAKMEITTPPPRVSYNDGDTIDYSGIVVTLYDGNGNVFTDSRYPDGIVPFSELVFPVDKAHYEGGGEWTDGHGLNAMQIAYTSHRNRAEWVKFTPGKIDENQVFVCGSALGTYNGRPATFGGDAPGTLFVTRYYVPAYGTYYNYMASMAGSRKCDLCEYYDGELDASQQRILTGWFFVGGSSASAGNKVFQHVSWEQFLTDIPVSTVDPTTIDPATLHAVQSIPVNWISPYNADTYTDEFDIVVHEESGSAD